MICNPKIDETNKYNLYAEGLSKGTQASHSVKWNMYKWEDDMKHPGYETEVVCAQS